MPPLLADFTHARPCKPFCEKYLTLPKNEEFVLNQFKGCTRGELVQKWGNPDGSLFGFYGDIWSITENESLVVYYSAESTVEHIKLHQNEKNN